MAAGRWILRFVELFDNIVDIIAVAGDNHLGGRDIDRAVADAFYAKYQELKRQLNLHRQASVLNMAEQCKMNLTGSDQAMMVLVNEGRDL